MGNKYTKPSPTSNEILEDGAFDALGKMPYLAELKKALPDVSLEDVRRGFKPGGFE